MNKKGLFLSLSNIVAYIIFIGFFILFIFMAVTQSKTINKNINSDFQDLDANTVLLTLLRTAVNVDEDGDGTIDYETVADMVAYSQNHAEIQRHVSILLDRICKVNGEYVCDWSINFEKKRLSFSSNAGWKFRTVKAKKHVGETSLPFIDKDNKLEVTGVVLKIYRI